MAFFPSLWVLDSSRMKSKYQPNTFVRVTEWMWKPEMKWQRVAIITGCIRAGKASWKRRRLKQSWKNTIPWIPIKAFEFSEKQIHLARSVGPVVLAAQGNSHGGSEPCFHEKEETGPVWILQIAASHTPVWAGRGPAEPGSDNEGSVDWWAMTTQTEGDASFCLLPLWLHLPKSKPLVLKSHGLTCELTVSLS